MTGATPAIPLPLYFQLQQYLLERIRSGEFAAGQALPTEEALCREYNYSRITVRRAIENLCGEGIVYRRRGVGTFVGNAPRSLRLVGSLEDVVAHVGELRIISTGSVPAASPANEFFATGAGHAALRTWRILYSIAAGPFSVSDFFVPAAIAKKITPRDIQQDRYLYKIIEKKTGVEVVRAKQLIEPVICPAEIAGHLRIPEGTAVLRGWRTYYGAGDQVLQAVLFHYHPKRYQHTLEFFARPRLAVINNGRPGADA